MKQRLIIFSFILSVAILVAKFYAYYLSGASTQLTDALESIINVVAAIFAYYSIYLASNE
jgi:divalent metal cation (Fe/Co/Zn/Cd) transporter